MKWLKQIGIIWLKQVRLSIYIFLAIILLMGLFLLWDAHFMPAKEVLECLTRIYGREFTVLAARSLAEAERADDVWRVKLYAVAPADEPERQFWAFNIVKGESGGVFGMSGGLADTYALELLTEAFVERAAGKDLAYAFTYRHYPCSDSTEYYSHLNIVIEPVSAENLAVVCDVVAQALADTLAQVPSMAGCFAGVDFVIIYHEADWPADEDCRIYLEPFYDWSDDNFYAETGSLAEKIRNEVLAEASRHTEKK